MTEQEKKAWEELVADAEAGAVLIPARRIAILAKDAECKRLREALSCTAENCSEFGRYHDGDCSECPQGTIRARAGLAAKEGP